MSEGADKAGLLSVGKMASMNKVTVKTLYVYQRHGLLKPSYVDEDTGYRYYDLSQCSIVDEIIRLQGLGFSLDEIHDLFSDGDIGDVRNRLVTRKRELEAQRKVLDENLAVVGRLVGRCDDCLRLPVLGEIVIESVPRRRVIRFDVPPSASSVDEASTRRRWELTLRSVKDRIVSAGLPLSLFGNVACVIPQASLEDRSFVFTQALVFVDPAYGDVYEHAEVLPAAQRVVMYFRHSYDGGDNLEFKAVTRMLDYIAHKRLHVAGDYIGEVVADTPLFGYAGRDAFFKPTIPVSN